MWRCPFLTSTTPPKCTYLTGFWSWNEGNALTLPIWWLSSKIVDITHFKLIFHKNIFSSPKIHWIFPFLLISPKICWFSALNVGKVVRVPICSCTRQICRFCPIYVGFLSDIGNFGHFVLASPKNLLFPPLILIWLPWFTTKTPRYSIFEWMFRKRECCLVACK